MQMVYNSDSFTVVQIELPGVQVRPQTGAAPAEVPAFAADALPLADHPDGPEPGPARGGFEIVDKAARREIFIEGPLAEHFRQGVQRLVEAGEASEEAFDDYIAGFASLAQHPLVMH